VALGLCAVLLLTTAAPAQKKRTKSAPKKRVTAVTGAETGLGGIRLFDSGTRVVSIYGSPDEIQAVTSGGMSAGPGGGPAAGGGKGGMGTGGMQMAPVPPPPGGATGPLGPADFGFGNDVLDRQMLQAPTPPPRDSIGGGGTGGGGGGGGMMGGGEGSRVVYTRWVYNRNASKFGFVMDKYNRVVQCEAIGIQAGKARTRRGITFGSNWASMIKKYGAPDGYEIAGDNIVARYLSKAKCAFRFSRLGENKPHVVTGIVVAAGKR